MIKGKQKLNIINNRYNKLLVINVICRDEKDKHNRNIYYAVCLCDCGNKKEILTSSLKAGRTGSCGCDRSQYNKISGPNSKNYTGFKEISGTFWKGYKHGAKRRKIIFDMSIEYAWSVFELQEQKCALSGVKLEFRSGKNSNTTASIDRIDNSKGYIKGNIQWVHKKINLMRNILSIGEFKEWCRRVVDHD